MAEPAAANAVRNAARKMTTMKIAVLARVSRTSAARARIPARSRGPQRSRLNARRERDEDEHDLHGGARSHRRLVEVVDPHEGSRAWSTPAVISSAVAMSAVTEKRQNRRPERARVLRRLVASREEHAPEERDHTAGPYRHREHVNEVERHALQASESRRMGNERRRHGRGDPSGERDHARGRKVANGPSVMNTATRERADGPHQRKARRDRDRGGIKPANARTRA